MTFNKAAHLTDSWGFSAETVNWIAAVAATGFNTSATQARNVDNLILAYKAAGIWSILDREWLYASENTGQAKVDIVGRASHTIATGSPTFTANRGYDGGGTSAIDTGFHTGNYVLNSGSLGAYIFTSRSSFADIWAIGHGSGPTSAIIPYGTASDFQGYVDSNFPADRATANAQGNLIANRSSSSNIDLLKNADSAYTTTAIASVSLVNGNFIALAQNVTPNRAYTGIVSSVFIGGALTQTQAIAKNAALNTYMTAVGANVY